MLAVTLGSAAWGQAANYPQGAIVQSLEPGPGDDLARYLSELNTSPRSVRALLGAGNAALALGDKDGALSFFARAEEVAPRDGRVKAGMGSAFVASENPEAAFKFFAEAQSLGVQVADFAKDRGLAYDMIGDPARAQADYALALRRGPDAEVERRMALSRAISGDRAGALAVLDPQIQKQDRAGWRARAFVLALTGDAAGAASVAQTMMPGNQSAALRPFLDKLAGLSAADKAMAVHFGHFPNGGQATRYAAAGVPSTAYAPPPARQTAQASPLPRVSSYGPSYRGVAEPQGSSAPPPVRPAPAPIRSVALSPSANAEVRVPQSVQPSPAPAVQKPAPESVVRRPAPSVAQKPAPVPAKPVAVTAPRLDFADVVDAVESLPAPVQKTQPMPFKAATPGTPPKLAEKKPEPKPAAATAEKKPAASKAAATKTVAKKAEPPKPKEPARIWVQLAAGANKNVFPAEYKKMQAKAPKLLSGKTAWTAPLGATNRLLVGPFKTDKEARDLVNALSAVKVGSYPWKSEDGDKVEKVAAK